MPIKQLLHVDIRTSIENGLIPYFNDAYQSIFDKNCFEMKCY